jgi:hypothetical protein
MAQAAKETKTAKESKEAKAAKERRRPVEPAPETERAPEEREDAEPAGGSHVCDVAFCPIGLALTAVEHVQPDVVSHLLLAGREFFLAAKAVMDARAEDLGRDAAPEGRTRMERIDIG